MKQLDVPERDEETLRALRRAAPHLRAELGRQVRLKYLPELHFQPDPAVITGRRVEEIIRGLHDGAPAPGPEDPS